MSIEKMSIVRIVGSLEKLDPVLLRCCKSEMFHIQSPTNGIAMSGFHQSEDENPYSSMLQTTIDVMNLLTIPPHYKDYAGMSLSEEKLQGFLDSAKETVTNLNKQESVLNDEISMHKQALTQVEHLRGMDVEIEAVLTSKSVYAHFGRLPSDSFLKLDYFKDKPFFFFDFDHDDDYHWGIYFTPYVSLQETTQIFNSLYFEEIEIPDFAHGTPEAASRMIEEKLKEFDGEIKQCKKDLAEFKANNCDLLLEMYSKLKMEADTFAYRRYAGKSGNKFYLEGFVPTREIVSFSNQFADLKDVICEEQPVESDKRIEPPVKLRTNWFFRPFEMFVKMYGLPGYYEMNPTTFVGFIYVVLFGIMFGDLGQGLVICLLGIFLWKKKKIELGAIMSRLGISSMIFGTAYGSVFGYEDLLNPMFKLFGFMEKPIEVFKPQTTNMLLISAVAIGIVIILACIIINIYLGLKVKNVDRAVLSNNGIIGLVLYGGAILAAVLLITSGINLLTPVFIIPVIIIPMLLLMFKEPLVKLLQHKKNIKLEGGVAGFILQNFFELFEICLSYLTNTLSFLRIGGFILSHAGMMAVVMSLAEMVSGGGSIVVVIIGNIFVMCLEGLIAGIQVLRLVFYETFSRFYAGEGKAFSPVKVTFGAAPKANKK